MSNKKKKQSKKSVRSVKTRNLANKHKYGLTFVKLGEKRKLKFLVVEWKDHAVSGNRANWNSIDDVKVKSLLCHTAGWLVDENSESIALAQNVGENGTVGEIMTVLKSCIVKRQEL